jgi:phosphohistidine phosphatase
MSTTNAEDQRKVAEMKVEAEKVRLEAVSGSALATFQAVQIEHGVQKYVLIEASDEKNAKKYLVRGLCSAEYHRDAARETVMALSEAGLVCNVTGGGRIACDQDQKTVKIYGFSYGYGLADHSISQAAIEADASFQGFSVTRSNEGY